MYNLRARLMEPGRGRFWNSDTWDGNNEEPQSLHKYLYCDGDPIDFHDRNGHDLAEVMAAITVASIIMNIGGIASGIQNIENGNTAEGNLQITMGLVGIALSLIPGGGFIGGAGGAATATTSVMTASVGAACGLTSLLIPTVDSIVTSMASSVRGGGGQSNSGSSSGWGANPDDYMSEASGNSTPASEMPVLESGSPQWNAVVGTLKGIFKNGSNVNKVVRVRTLEDAKNLMNAVLDNRIGTKYPQYFKDSDYFDETANARNSYYGYEVHPAEMTTRANDLPHMLWCDLRNGTNNVIHIFFGE